MEYTEREKTTEPKLSENPRYADVGSWGLTSDGWKVFRPVRYIIEYSPSDIFCALDKEYHRNGMLKAVHQRLFNRTIGMTLRYDSEGYLAEKENEDFYYRQLEVKPQDLADFLEKEGWYDRKTGVSYLGDMDYEPRIDGEFTYMIFQSVKAKYASGKWYVRLNHIRAIPPQFLDKYSNGTVDPEGNKCLPDWQTGQYREGAVWSVIYTIDAQTYKSSVKWMYGVMVQAEEEENVDE